MIDATNGNGNGTLGHAEARLIAFYLPQYHPIPENDQWWGKGFTEWTNVVKARSLFPGHNHPHLPADLGFYDLRLPEARRAQADLARDYGIHGFCYYHYWFNGRRLLERPFNDVLRSGEPDFPFCLCWANENWTRAWDGFDREILVAQAYSVEDDREHLRWLATAFADPRYIRVDGKPLFLVYRASRLPDIRRTTDTWREEAQRLGLGDLYLARVEAFEEDLVGDPRDWGFDAAVDFAPDWRNVGPRVRFKGKLRRWGRRLKLISDVFARHKVFRYDELARLAMAKEFPEGREVFRSVTPMWDNSPRKANGAYIFHGSTPEAYGRWLSTLLEQAEARPPDHRIVFINAWNEWGEGCHLEPDQANGHAYLEATRDALIGLGARGGVR